ncbi:hypothetical protein ACFOSV_01100 [Algoriphagus namhaensis]|uniref:DUF975 family protein n=1 Tax=Algoriphagus namhaensis TaxID=915353 RepID=A0ABV8AM03_9BACT
MNRAKLEQIIVQGVDFEIRAALDNGWKLFKEKAPLHVGFTFIIIVIQVLFTLYLEDFLFIFSIFLSPPLVIGFYLAGNKISQGEWLEFSDFFDGFKYWLPVVIINLVSSILAVLGLFALVIPGVYLLIGYMFSLLFGVFGGFEFWASMELSRRLVHTNWWKFFALGLVLLLINLLGILTLGIGLFISIPLTYLTVYALFEELTSEAAEEPAQPSLD